MANPYFRFKQFTIHQDRCAMKVTTDACLFGAWVALEVKNQNSKVKNILDIGAGTGLLSLMLAQNTTAHIDAIEIDKTTAEQAAENINASPWKDRVSIIPGDIKDEAVFPEQEYNIIISNPPFYENELRSVNSLKNVAHHNESLSLDELIPIIKHRLSATGKFYLLLPYKRRKEVETLFKKTNVFFFKMVSVRQSVNHDYFRLMISGSLHEESKTEESEIAIRDEQDQYTPGFTRLLKDYYLYL